MTDSEKVNIVLPPILLESFQEFLSMYQSLYSKSSKVRKKSPMMIIGNPGVGKTLFSDVFVESYKNEYGIPDNKIKRINVAAIPKDLIEGTLFGYKKGAFTGAVNNYAGLIGEMENGIIVFDEIGELSKEVQAKLLTFIEDGYYYSLGDDRKKESRGLQIVATTNRTFESGCFRQDFYDRFYPYFILPIHKRREDILYYWAYLFPELTRKLSPIEVLTILTYHWPGNVREIERVGQQIIARMDYFKIISDIPDTLRDSPLVALLPEYSEMSLLYMGPLREGLEKSDVDHELLESVMNHYGLGFSHEQKKFPFAGYKVHLNSCDDYCSCKFNIECFKPIRQFDLAFKGLNYYCYLFKQNIYGNKDLLDVTEGYHDTTIDIEDYLEFLKDKTRKKMEKRFYLIENVHKFIRLKTGKDKEPPEQKQDINTDEKALEILSLRQDELLNLYYMYLIKVSNGNKAEAARKAGLNYRTFLSSLKRYDI